VTVTLGRAGGVTVAVCNTLTPALLWDFESDSESAGLSEPPTRRQLAAARVRVRCLAVTRSRPPRRRAVRSRPGSSESDSA
jgi:hypothetical protein